MANDSREYVLESPARTADARIAYGPGPDQFGDLRRPNGPGPLPVAVLVHGGYWRARYDLSHMSHAAIALTDAGYATWTPEYRRVGQPGGGWAGTFEDVGAALDHLCSIAPAHRLDLERVVVVGFSAGGHLALWLAGRPRLPPEHPLRGRAPLVPRGVVALAAVPDLRAASERGLGDYAVHELLGGSPADYPDRYASTSPVELLPLGISQVLIHGDADASVPCDLSASYVSRARELGDPAELISLPDVGHFELVDPRSEAWPVVRGAIDRLA